MLEENSWGRQPRNTNTVGQPVLGTFETEGMERGHDSWA